MKNHLSRQGSIRQGGTDLGQWFGRALDANRRSRTTFESHEGHRGLRGVQEKSKKGDAQGEMKGHPQGRERERW